MKGRPADPKRATRKTGNRPKPGEAKPAKTVVPAVVLSTTPSTPATQYPPPASVPPEVHSVWHAAVADLGGSNNMRASFVPALEAYCMAVYTHAMASANIREFGVLVKGPNGQPVPNPLLKVQKEAAATMLRFAETLGLTPSGRIRLGLMEITGMSLLASLNESLDGKRG